MPVAHGLTLTEAERRPNIPLLAVGALINYELSTLEFFGRETETHEI